MKTCAEFNINNTTKYKINDITKYPDYGYNWAVQEITKLPEPEGYNPSPNQDIKNIFTGNYAKCKEFFLNLHKEIGGKSTII
jgi:hypothetical protein